MTKRTKAPSGRKANTVNGGSLIMSHDAGGGYFAHLDAFQRRRAVIRMLDLGRVLDGVRARLRGAA